MLLTTIKPVKNFDKLKTEILNVISLVGSEHPQIICQGNNPESNDWLTGTGSITGLKIQNEFHYTHLNPALIGTEIANLIEEYQGVRTRIMTLKPRSCYSVHSDPTMRIHIPIITTAESWMIWPKDNYCSQLIPGYGYLTDTTKYHTFLNGSTEDRIHLVMCIDRKNYQKFLT